MADPAHDPLAPCSPAQPLDLKALDAVGMLHVPGFIPSTLLALLREGVSRLLTGGEVPRHHHFCLSGTGRIARVNEVAQQGFLPELLLLLGCPSFRMLVADICGDDGVITQTDLLVRYNDDPHPINWHQDAVTEPGNRWVALGFALDDTMPGDGDLMGVAGSHEGPCDIGRLETVHGWNPPNLIRAAPVAGDLIIHHVMLVHGSSPPVSLACRRTLYVYIDSVSHIVRAMPANLDWAGWRAGLSNCAVAAWQAWCRDDDAWRHMRWPGDAPVPLHQTFRGSSANYAIRHDGRLLGNSYDLFPV